MEGEVVHRARGSPSPEAETGEPTDGDAVLHLFCRVLAAPVVRTPRAKRRDLMPARDQTAREVVKMLPRGGHVGRVELVDEEDAHAMPPLPVAVATM